ncbi:hypothetical protein J4232_06425 [Candidatus Woesearchaeota archaeon]|nr:hypothetical protein [Candidatus Woesearchaeota archaeon]
MKKVLRDTPLMEITLRRYERPDKSNPRELVKKFCLSIGLLQPGDSRDIIVDILYVLLRAKQEKKLMDSEQIKEAVIALRKEFNLQLLGVASSNVRRQIKRLRDVLLVEKIKNDYRIIEFSHLSEIYQQKFEQLLLPTIVSRIKEYMKEVDAVFG